MPKTVSASPSTKNISSTIAAVTVYKDRASVIRKGKTSLSAGTHSLFFTNLPIEIVDQSVRVSGEGEGARILDVKVETMYTDTIPQERLRTLQTQLEELQEEMKTVDDKIVVLQSQLDFINKIKIEHADNISKDLKITRPTVEDWQKVLGFFNTNMTKLYSDLRKSNLEKKELHNKIIAVQEKIRTISPNNNRATKTIIVEVEVTKSGEFVLLPQYVITGAMWYPQYDIRVNTENNSVQLEYRAMVQQRTGEDWNNIELALSTARPDMKGEMPELSAWYVNIFAPEVFGNVSGGRSQDRNRPLKKALNLNQRQLLNDVKTEKERSDEFAPVMEEPVASVETQTTSVLLRIPTKSTIPSDNVSHKVTVAIEKLKAAFVYTSTPKLSQFAYLKALIENTSEVPLLAGNINVFSDEDFVSTTSIETIVPNEKFYVYLGIDPTIKIERKLVNKFTETTGTFSKNNKISYEYTFTLENTKKTAQTIFVYDQLPLSQNEQITIEQLEPKEKELKPNEEGFLIWKNELQPKEKKTWKLKYSIEYPPNVRISGAE